MRSLALRARILVAAVLRDGKLRHCVPANDGEVAFEGCEMTLEGSWLFLRSITVSVGFANRRGTTMNHWQQPPHAMMNHALM